MNTSILKIKKVKFLYTQEKEVIKYFKIFKRSNLYKKWKTYQEIDITFPVNIDDFAILVLKGEEMTVLNDYRGVPKDILEKDFVLIRTYGPAGMDIYSAQPYESIVEQLKKGL